jgi:hypothetical protein
VARLHYLAAYGVRRGEKILLTAQRYDEHDYEMQMSVLRALSPLVYYTHTYSDARFYLDNQTGETVLSGTVWFAGKYLAFVALMSLIGMLSLLATPISFLFAICGTTMLITAFIHWASLLIYRYRLLKRLYDMVTADHSAYEDFVASGLRTDSVPDASPRV